MFKKSSMLPIALLLAIVFALSACGGGGTASTTTAQAATTAATTAAATTTAAAAEGAATTAAAAGTATTAAAAAGGEATFDENGLSGVNQFPLVQEKTELSMFVAPSALIEDINQNEFTKWYEEKTNVHVVWEAVPEQSRLERLNLILAANDLPDVIFGGSVTRDDEMVYGPQGRFIDLTPYIEKHGYYIKEMFEAVPYAEAGIRAADGHIYSLPHVNECFHCIYDNARIWINTRIRNELGLEVPTTTEEFRTYLTALKDAGQLTVVGSVETDKTQLNRIVGFLGNSFTYMQDRADSLQIVDGVVKASYTQPEFKEALKYMNSLYAEGLIDPTTFTNSGDELKQMVEDPNGNRVGIASAYYFGSIGSLEGERHKEYDMLYPLTGPTGLAYASYNPYRHATGEYIVTDVCENPDLAVKWADYLYSDDAAVRYVECGREGIEWRVPEPTELDMYGRPAKRARIDDGGAYSETTNVHYYQDGPSFRSFDWRESWFRGAGDMYGMDAYEWRLFEATKGLVKFRPNMTTLRSYPPVYATVDDARELKRITANIKDHRTQYVDAFITGQRDIDAEWDAYIAGFEQLELPLYLEIKQRGYDASDYKNSVPVPANPDAPEPWDEPINK